LLDYEEHAIDLETGEPTDAPGGYEFVKDVIGYAPLTVSGFEKYGDIGNVLRNLYYEKGALFLVLHSELGNEDPVAIDLGEKREPLYARPSTVDVRLFESVGQDTSLVIQKAEQEAVQAGVSPVFLSIKMHEDDFYADGVSPWRYAYYNMDEKRKSAQTPPYDITAAEDAALLPEKERDAMWQHYENAVAYVASQNDLEAINAFDLEKMI
jgi:hypothetical protein